MIPNTRWTPEDRHLLRVNGIVPVELAKGKDYWSACGLMIALVAGTMGMYLLYHLAQWAWKMVFS